MNFKGGFGGGCGGPPFKGGGPCMGGGPGGFPMAGKGPGMQSGQTLNGMVKSYNRKGFGFLMVLGMDNLQDIYYTRENLSPRLQTRDIPGQHVTFEIHRYPDGKMTAMNIRPIGEERDPIVSMKGKGMPMGKGGCFGGVRPVGFGHPAHISTFVPGPSLAQLSQSRRDERDDEDRSRDWICSKCSERNFVKRFECFKCKEPRASSIGDDREAPRETMMAPRRTLSPHAGARAIREALRAQRAGGSPASSSSRGSKRKRSSSGSKSKSSASSSSSEGKKKKKKKKKGKKRKRSKSGSSSGSSRSVDSSSRSSSCCVEQTSNAAASSSAAADPEVEKAKGEALQQLMKLKGVQPKEQRMKDFRALLREWHPDKNPARTEVATAVFQFLQKGKQVLEAASA
mmetsp:Transcript_66421/g.194818  ORF Transcript_66421/g.194818 Transcript_66421/m.194818 type:complete len:398 (+) Transcript_66421:222-1415(+)